MLNVIENLQDAFSDTKVDHHNIVRAESPFVGLSVYEDYNNFSEFYFGQTLYANQIDILEAMTKTKGWVVVEEFMLRKMNIVGLIYNKDNEESKGIAKGYVELMQYIDQVIKAKEELISKETHGPEVE